MQSGELCNFEFVFLEIRRIINSNSFATNPDPSTMEVITSTASRTQAPALKDLLYKYLMGEASIGVTIPVSLMDRIERWWEL